MTFDDAQKWSIVLAPWATIFVSVWIARRVQAVHKLVNSEMDQFRATLKKLADANEAIVFSQGQQDVRDKNRTALRDAAHATEAAAVATSDAARAITPP